MISVLLFSLFTVLSNSGIQTPDGWLALVTAALEQIPPVTLIPRFVLSLRELYAQETRASNTDAAFGFGSEFGHGALRSPIQFADIRRGGSDEQGEETQMEGWVQNVRHVKGRV